MAGISTIMRNLNRDIDEVLNNSGLAPCILKSVLESKVAALERMDAQMYAMELQQEQNEQEMVESEPVESTEDI